MKINGTTVDALAALAEDVAKLLHYQYGISRDYGYLAAYDVVKKRFILIVEVGNPPAASRSFVFCQEKATRLASNPTHFTSFESRNLSRNQLDGAVRFGDIILSFSGFTEELADEALVVLVAYKSGWNNYTSVLKLTGFSKNPYVRKVLG